MPAPVVSDFPVVSEFPGDCDFPGDARFPDDADFVEQCLLAALYGPFFPEWEFFALTGVRRATVAQVLCGWPHRTLPRFQFRCAVQNVLAAFVHYPHRQERELAWRVPGAARRLRPVLKRIVAAWRPDDVRPDDMRPGGVRPGGVRLVRQRYGRAAGGRLWPVEDMLDARDIEFVRLCLRALVEGRFVPDWEFGTVMGVERPLVRQVLRDWPRVSVPVGEFKCAVQNGLLNLWGYPHRKERALARRVPGVEQRLGPMVELVADAWHQDEGLARRIRYQKVGWDDLPAARDVLTRDEIAFVRRCLLAAVEGSFFPGTRFKAAVGVERDRVRQVLRDWPWQTLPGVDFMGAVLNPMNALWGWPHSRDRAQWDRALMRRVPGAREKLVPVLGRLVSAWREREE